MYKAKEPELGYIYREEIIRHSKFCVLSIGSIIIFNGQKHIVTHTNDNNPRKTFAGRRYINIKGIYTDITLGSSGYLKNIETGKEYRCDWHNVTQDRILHFEHLEEIKKDFFSRL
jgi:hypothetical protein